MPGLLDTSQGQSFGLLAMPPPVDGMVRPGNIDLGARPVVKNRDGTISTVKSMSIGIDGVEWLIPIVSDTGQMMNEQQAVAHFKRTGRHLGAFASPELATNYANVLHEQQAKMYGGR